MLIFVQTICANNDDDAQFNDNRKKNASRKNLFTHDAGGCGT